ncbi:hypothetical protein ACHAXA_004831 [Cyclostephanos tholiformis]|uniref:Uncharacterized protein n=1 Tax=Cyclostephanos tholiformis TaxID=382380 RepID=A0ABD3SHH5_9STRA
MDDREQQQPQHHQQQRRQQQQQQQEQQDQRQIDENGRCTLHPGIQLHLLKKNGEWRVLLTACPLCVSGLPATGKPVKIRRAASSSSSIMSFSAIEKEEGHIQQQWGAEVAEIVPYGGSGNKRGGGGSKEEEYKKNRQPSYPKSPRWIDAEEDNKSNLSEAYDAWTSEEQSPLALRDLSGEGEFKGGKTTPERKRSDITPPLGKNYNQSMPTTPSRPTARPRTPSPQTPLLHRMKLLQVGGENISLPPTLSSHHPERGEYANHQREQSRYISDEVSVMSMSSVIRNMHNSQRRQLEEQQQEQLYQQNFPGSDGSHNRSYSEFTTKSSNSIQKSQSSSSLVSSSDDGVAVIPQPSSTSRDGGSVGGVSGVSSKSSVSKASIHKKEEEEAKKKNNKIMKKPPISQLSLHSRVQNDLNDDGGVGAIAFVTRMPYTDINGEYGWYTGQVNSSTGDPHGIGTMNYANGFVIYEVGWHNGVYITGGNRDKEEKMPVGDTISRRQHHVTPRTPQQGMRTHLATLNEDEKSVNYKYADSSSSENDSSSSRSPLPDLPQQQQERAVVCGMLWTDLNGDDGVYTGEVNYLKNPDGMGSLRYDYGMVVEGVWRDGEFIYDEEDDNNSGNDDDFVISHEKSLSSFFSSG